MGAFPDGVPDDVGSWLLVHDGEALLLEVPPGVTAKVVRAALREVDAKLIYATASHSHEDHLDEAGWKSLQRAFKSTEFIHPADVKGDQLLHLGGEPVWLVKAPKHSPDDVVTIFRGVAMTGDIELMMLASVNNEVPTRTKRQSLDRLRDFQTRCGYHVHSAVSAHLNSVRTSVNWPDLFWYEVK
jgi:glyoxylase-like metal-dependent hydrolase (beta-lactamase superfamily II)